MLVTSQIGDGAGSYPAWATDTALAIGDARYRDAGLPGYDVQSLVFLKARMDEAAVRLALSRLRERYPVISSRLTCRGGRGEWCWRFRHRATVNLRIVDLTAAGQSAVIQYAERLLSADTDPRKSDPVTFHLLRGPNGRDVFIIQWSHVLADGKAGELVLQQIDRLWAGAADGDAASTDGVDIVRAYLGRIPWRRRLRSFLHFAAAVRPRGRTARLSRPDAPRFDRDQAPVRLAIRSLDQHRTEGFKRRVRRLCGFFNPAPVLLASAFRGVREFTPGRLNRRSAFTTMIPLNLRPPNAPEPIFRNFQSYVQAHAVPADLDDRDALARKLQGQMRRQLRQGVDTGFLRGCVLMSRSPGWVVDWSQRLVQRIASLAYGYHGWIDGMDSFCGTPVDRIYSGVPGTSSPPGMVLAANGSRRHLNLMVSYIPDAIPRPVIGQFLDFLAEDLCD